MFNAAWDICERWTFVYAWLDPVILCQHGDHHGAIFSYANWRFSSLVVSCHTHPTDLPTSCMYSPTHLCVFVSSCQNQDFHPSCSTWKTLKSEMCYARSFMFPFRQRSCAEDPRAPPFPSLNVTVIGTCHQSTQIISFFLKLWLNHVAKAYNEFSGNCLLLSPDVGILSGNRVWTAMGKKLHIEILGNRGNDCSSQRILGHHKLYICSFS